MRFTTYKTTSAANTPTGSKNTNNMTRGNKVNLSTFTNLRMEWALLLPYYVTLHCTTLTVTWVRAAATLEVEWPLDVRKSISTMHEFYYLHTRKANPVTACFVLHSRYTLSKFRAYPRFQLGWALCNSCHQQVPPMCGHARCWFSQFSTSPMFKNISS